MIVLTYDVNCKVLEVDDKYIICEINHVKCAKKVIITYVYAKCKDYLRRPLCDDMLQQSRTVLP